MWVKGASQIEMVEILQGFKFPMHNKLSKKFSLVGVGGFKMSVTATK